MSSVDPFTSRFEVFGRQARQVVPEINEEGFKRLVGHLSPEPGADGRVVLLSAPRAGFGKTLLIQRVAETLTENHHFVKVTLMGGRTIDAAHVLEFVLESLCQVLPAADGLTMLDMAARRIIARGLEPLVRSGEVPCQDREGALLALQESPVETFDFHHESAVTAHWTEANFEILGPRLAAEVAQVSGASLREAAYWVELLFRFATTSPENVERSRLLFETVFRPDGLKPSESGAGERLHGLLSLLGIATAIVLVVDDTEGLSTHPPDALELATFLTNLAQTCPGTLVLLSVNTDVWDTAFAPRLPGGLSDRLTEHRVLLKPLSREGAENIVRSRGGNRASDVLARMDWGEGDLYARRVLRAASEAWDAVVEESKEDVAAVAPEEDLKEAEEIVSLPEPVVKSEEGPVSFSPGAATFLAKKVVDPVAVTDLEKALPEVSDDVPEVDSLAEDLKALDAFEPSAYATPTTPLDAGPDQPDEVVEKEAESSPVSQLATPSEPLVSEEEKSSSPSSPFDLAPKPAEPDAAPEFKKAEEVSSSSFAPDSDVPPAGFAPVEPGSLSAEPTEKVVAEKKPEVVEKPASPFAAAPPVSTPFTPDQADVPKEEAPVSKVDEPASPTVEDSPCKSPFAKVWEKAEAEVAKEEDADAAESGDSEDVWADESPTPPSSPFAAVTPTVPPSPFAPAEPDNLDDAKAEEVAETPTAEKKEESLKPSPFAPASSEEKVSDVVLPDDSEPSPTPSPSPFAPAEPSSSEIVLPPESGAAPESSPFRPVTGKSEQPSPSPFEAVNPSSEKKDDQESGLAKGLGALTGGSPISEPVSPFEKGSSGEGDSAEKSSPPPFNPVGGIPPKRPDPSPFSPVRNVGGSPFEKASAPGSVEEPSASSPPPLDEKANPTPESSSPPPVEKSASGPPPFEERPAAEEKPPSSSPFSPVGPAPEKPSSSPFAAAGGDSGAEADSDDEEDKVDELLRQFKQRYGRD